MHSSAIPIADDLPYAKATGDEPIPGYRLIEPIGRGGFGEVWKCEAPGGLHKAVKIVSADPEMTNSSSSRALEQEYEAFQQIKLIRHPFLLQLERVELVQNELVMVMELADCQLADRFNECRAKGMAGIPRRELLGYYVDAAEALDLIGRKHNLQHLDIKPANLFLLSNHVKVGDYGLLARMEANPAVNAARLADRGMTPRYVAPEVLRGQIHPQSDQYSLALVYYELLTGGFPYTARTPHQMMLQHVQAQPNLGLLPPTDGAAVARALSKNPADRFPSCLAFVQALIVGPDVEITYLDDTAVHGPVANQPTAPARPPVGSTTRRPGQPLTVPGGRSQLPALTTQSVARPPAAIPPSTPTPIPVPRRGIPEPVEEEVALTLSAAAPEEVRLDPIESVVAAPRLLGFPGDPAVMTANQFIEEMLAAAATSVGGYVALMPGEVAVTADGTWATRFPTTLLPSVIPLKLATLRDDGWCDEVQIVDKTTFVLRANAAGGGLFGRKKGGAEVTVKLPPTRPGAGLSRMSGNGLSGAGGLSANGRGSQVSGLTPMPDNRETAGVCEADVTGRIFGTPDGGFTRSAQEAIPALIGEVRKLLLNVDDRRKSPRLPIQAAVTIYPIHEDGRVEPAMAGETRDVSAGGLCCVTRTAPPCRYVYVEFPESAALSGMAILTRLTRTHFTGTEQVIAGRFRTDL